jgi:hypothetical protein
MAISLDLPRANDLQSVRSEIERFGAWRLSRLLTAAERASYDDLCRRERELLGWPNRNAQAPRRPNVTVRDH